MFGTNLAYRLIENKKNVQVVNHVQRFIPKSLFDLKTAGLRRAWDLVQLNPGLLEIQDVES